MKIIKSDVPESYLKLIEKAVSKNICAGLNTPEDVRLKVRDELREKILLSGEFSNRDLNQKDNNIKDSREEYK
ncbi:MAG: hypothetical protein EAX91_17920 [Candidatus Lokiarchaeota archaeon]|nr:hypothetical protein [Candidatus Lokiarchaeota archaeon]